MAAIDKLLAELDHDEAFVTTNKPCIKMLCYRRLMGHVQQTDECIHTHKMIMNIHTSIFTAHVIF